MGFELGARVAYGIPFGRASDEGDHLDEFIAGQVPLWLDLGVRVDRVFVGGYFQYGLGLLGDDVSENCEEIEDAAEARPNADADARCHVRDVRLGAQLHYHFGAPKEPDPWLGIGAGYEWVTLTLWMEDHELDQEATIHSTGKGFEFLNLQGGVDFPLGPTTALGPFFTWTLARYDHGSVSCSGDCGDITEVNEDIEDKAPHYWLFFGARFSFFP